MAPYEALYGRKCRSPMCWDDVGEIQLLGLEIIKDTVEKIKLMSERLRVADRAVVEALQNLHLMFHYSWLTIGLASGK
ncbi:unnamed protein product [Rhodiola kirilowii]